MRQRWRRLDFIGPQSSGGRRTFLVRGILAGTRLDQTRGRVLERGPERCTQQLN
jgi:hypothetical protein